MVVYPVYLDSTVSRKEGRRVPLSLAVPNPTIEEIVEVCVKLGLNPEVEAEKAYPRDFTRKGRIIVDKLENKLKTLYTIAKALKEARQHKHK